MSRPKLGEREDLRIEIPLAAVQAYQAGRLQATRVHMNHAEAEEELDDVLRLSYVVFSSGESMTVRGRVQRLNVDVQTDMIRVSPTHVRAVFPAVRYLRTGIKPGSSRALGVVVYSHTGEPVKLGYLRLSDDERLEWRGMAARSGEEAPPWVAPPANIGEIIAHERNERVRRWLAGNGAAGQVALAGGKAR